jgi:hypothetical protein
VVDNKKETQPRSVELPSTAVEKSQQNETQPEVESWMQKVEKRFARVPNKTTTPVDDQVVVQNQGSDQPPVTLPVTAAQVAVGKKANVDEGIAWLIAWVIRQWKQLTRLGRRVRLQDLPEINK